MAVLKPEDIQFIVVHCSATPTALDIGATEIDEWHRDRGWSGIGYHGVIRRNGAFEPGRPLNQTGAHVKGHNYHSLGVCLIGGVDKHGRPENNFTHEQFSCLRLTLKNWRTIAPQAEILGHRDLSPDIDGDGVIEAWEFMKDCPCFDVREWWGMAP